MLKEEKEKSPTKHTALLSTSLLFTHPVMVYSGRDIALFVIAFFFPPIPVLIKRGCGVDLLINICLFALGAGKFNYYTPGRLGPKSYDE